MEQAAVTESLPVSTPADKSRRVGSTDLLKLAGLVLVLVDHWGLFFAPDQDWWRVFGRLAAPIFFFFIGFARSRQVPWTWLVLGLALTATDYLTSANKADVSLNILLSFALLRTALPHVEARVIAWPLRTALLTGLCVALIPIMAPFLEYGAEGWLWALLGLAQRRMLEHPGPRAAWIRNGVAAVAALAYIVQERHDFDLETVQSTTLGILVAVLAASLARFRRAEFDAKPPGPLDGLLRIAGQRSLEIYGITLFLMQVAAYALGFRG